MELWIKILISIFVGACNGCIIALFLRYYLKKRLKELKKDELNQKAINDYKASQIDYRKQSGCENKQMLDPGIALYGGSIVHLSR